MQLIDRPSLRRGPGCAAPCVHKRLGKIGSSRSHTRASKITVHAAASGAANKQCVMWELDGGIVDLHMDAHRVAFNAAFSEYGYDCINFTVPLYNDLLSAGDGTAEGLLKAYFHTMGWPDMLATDDRPIFVRKIVEKKDEKLLKLLEKDKVPLRDGVDGLINEALAARVKVVFITGTLSDDADMVSATVMRQLGPDIATQIQTFHCNRTLGEESPEGATPSMSMSQMIQAETNKTKKSAATAFTQALKDATKSSIPAITIDNNLLAAGNRRTVTPELLAAIAVTIDVPLSNCVLVGASSSVTSAAIQAGITAVAIPRKMAFQGTYPGVRAKMEGYGFGLLNWPRLSSFLASPAEPAP